MTVKEIGIILGVAVLLVAIGVYVGRTTKKTETITLTEYSEGKHDTLWLPSKPIRDTVEVPASVTYQGDNVISRMDTTLRKDSSSVELHIVHKSNPNSFRLFVGYDLRPMMITRVDTVKIATETSTVYERTFFDRFSVGVGVSAVYTPQGTFTAGPSIGVYYEIF